MLTLGLNLGEVTHARNKGGGYDPFADPDVLDYWDANRSADVDLMSLSVTAWRSAKNGYSASQGGTNARPTYSATGLNNAATVSGDSVDDELTYTGAGNFPAGSAGGEIWLLTDQRALASDAATQTLFAYGAASATVNARRVIRQVVGGVNRAGIQVGNGSSAIIVTGSIVDFTGVHVLRAIVTPTSAAIEVDGIADGSASVVPNTIVSRLRLFASSGTSPATFSPAAISFAAITSPLSTSKAAQMLAYLKARGGIA